MRLIDADEFKKQILVITDYPADKVDEMCDLIDCQPTAFDLEGMIKQLENCKDDTFMYSKEEGILYEVVADVWARIADGTETQIVINSAANSTNGNNKD